MLDARRFASGKTAEMHIWCRQNSGSVSMVDFYGNEYGVRTSIKLLKVERVVPNARW